MMDKKNFKFYYGILLVAVGLGVFYRIPQVMLQIETIEFFKQKLFLVRSSFYILGGLLVLAGSIRIYKNYK
ncbi:hypothetical protein [Desulfobacula toluolica]|uniref:Uncharacterized protein n=1 Tax=Desulfobacula toluolica (strain DSM 7467 / Tol2) TaxID=651182 RepID=K0NP89_DESTT|nr:hypothetical protein [Desulfobacula toluolica]CCK80607.1 uncharacterized protein TOL2_C24460 [Desulfobacula toluolica Tol2]